MIAGLYMIEFPPPPPFPPGEKSKGLEMGKKIKGKKRNKAGYTAIQSRTVGQEQ